MKVSQIYGMPDSDSLEMTEEQFASLFAAMGFFKDLNAE